MSSVDPCFVNTDYLDRKQGNHFVSVNKSIDHSVFYRCDDLKPQEPINLGSCPSARWDIPTYLFYTVRRDDENVPTLPLQVQTTMDSYISVNPKDKCDSQMKNKKTMNLLNEPDSPTAPQVVWEYENPIGKRGYQFMKLFHAGWFCGEVVFVNTKTGKFNRRFVYFMLYWQVV
jgi:hypothetical protein